MTLLENTIAAAFVDVANIDELHSSLQLSHRSLYEPTQQQSPELTKHHHDDSMLDLRHDSGFQYQPTSIHPTNDGSSATFFTNDRITALENEIMTYKLELGTVQSQCDWYEMEHRRMLVEYEDLQAFCEQLQQQVRRNSTTTTTSDKSALLWRWGRTKILAKKRTVRPTPPLTPDRALHRQQQHNDLLREVEYQHEEMKVKQQQQHQQQHDDDDDDDDEKEEIINHEEVQSLVRDIGELFLHPHDSLKQFDDEDLDCIDELDPFPHNDNDEKSVHDDFHEYTDDNENDDDDPNHDQMPEELDGMSIQLSEDKSFRSKGLSTTHGRTQSNCRLDSQPLLFPQIPIIRVSRRRKHTEFDHRANQEYLLDDSEDTPSRARNIHDDVSVLTDAPSIFTTTTGMMKVPSMNKSLSCKTCSDHTVETTATAEMTVALSPVPKTQHRCEPIQRLSICSDEIPRRASLIGELMEMNLCEQQQLVGDSAHSTSNTRRKDMAQQKQQYGLNSCTATTLHAVNCFLRN